MGCADMDGAKPPLTLLLVLVLFPPYRGDLRCLIRMFEDARR